METYCITAARPNDAEHHLNTEFKLWRREQRAGQSKWIPEGWKRIAAVVELLEAGHEVKTAKQGANGIRTGAPIEVVLRISRNDTDYPIGEMPNE